MSDSRSIRHGPTELIFAIASGVLLTLGFTAEVTHFSILTAHLCYAGSYFFGGTFTLIQSYRAIRSGKFDIDVLMLVAAAGAAILGEYAEGGLLLFLFSLGHALEHMALNRARNSISKLAGLTPETALVLHNGMPEEIAIDALLVGDTMVVKPNTRLPADGVVVKGSSTIDQSPITGESIPVNKSAMSVSNDSVLRMEQIPAEHRVFAGTINGAKVLHVQALKRSADSTLARLITMVQDAEEQKSPTQHFAERFERIFVPAVLVLVTLLMMAFLVRDEQFADSFYRAMAVLVAASPCALAISTPSAILAGVARAARGGVLIKGGGPLERLSELHAVAFDKTGTLTEGKPILTHVEPFGNTTNDELLQVAVAVESLSDHPLASAIVIGADKWTSISRESTATEMEALTARGVKANYRGNVVAIGNTRLMQEITGAPLPEYVSNAKQVLEQSGHTTMIVISGSRYLGILGIMDVARESAKQMVSALYGMGIAKTIMLTGDNQRVADAVGSEVGISEVIGDLLPEEKASHIRSLQKAFGHVAMVGDGVNDAPALATSSVGIAMGAAGSDVALETADVALMSDRIENLPWTIALGRKTRQIIKQNLWISLGMVAILVPLTMLGIAKMGPAVVAHEGSTLVVVLNALRLLGFKDRA